MLGGGGGGAGGPGVMYNSSHFTGFLVLQIPRDSSDSLLVTTLIIDRLTLCAPEPLTYVSGCCFTSLSAQSWQYRDRREPELCPTLYG